MGHVYFTRHGQTIWNVERKICGATDVGLTELGYAQATELGEKIKQNQYQIDEILYSPLIRAAETAKTIAKVTGIPASLTAAGWIMLILPVRLRMQLRVTR